MHSQPQIFLRACAQCDVSFKQYKGDVMVAKVT